MTGINRMKGIMAFLKEAKKMKVGQSISINDLHSAISLNAGISPVTKSTYSRALVEHGYMKISADGRFEILKFGDETPKQAKLRG